MDMPAEALVARALASIKMSATEFYVLCRVYSKTLPPINVKGLEDELQAPGRLTGPDNQVISYETVSACVRRLIERGYIVRQKQGMLQLTLDGTERFLITYAMTTIPLPDVLKQKPGMPDRDAVKLGHLGRSTRHAYGIAVYELRRMFQRITPERLRSVLAEYGLRPVPWGNQYYKPSALDEQHQSGQDGTVAELIVDDVTKRGPSEIIGGVASVKGRGDRIYRGRIKIYRTTKDRLNKRKSVVQKVPCSSKELVHSGVAKRIDYVRTTDNRD